ncbi:phage integrase Arm DNA-binding domain-containing protein [Microbulbifer bruguierae]|uniref:Phage integrase Arm DNA-binding domain-containing protein n=1 Tax=Microbulbifer bruguierae TaxID=3029061 RepID=A0ABY8NE31_9GAMM|nr:phage integrase Arm DNA-binding domain-containing protein [Microbulbifer bruguierae]WGL17168.1 phage integrase Arm DNA-binding domain-containing protein [Microbulbifer bruguierae]
MDSKEQRPFRVMPPYLTLRKVGRGSKFEWVYSPPWSLKEVNFGASGDDARREEIYDFAEKVNAEWVKKHPLDLDDFGRLAERPVKGGRRGPEGRPKYLSFRRNSTGKTYWHYRPPWLVKPVSLGSDKNAAFSYAELENERRDKWAKNQEAKLRRKINKIIKKRRKGYLLSWDFGYLVTEFSKSLKRTMSLRKHRLGVKPKLALYHKYLHCLNVEEVDLELLRIVLKLGLHNQDIYEEHRALLKEMYSYGKQNCLVSFEAANLGEFLPSDWGHILRRPSCGAQQF